MIGPVFDTALQGMQSAGDRLLQAAQRIANPERVLSTIESDSVEILASKHAFAANAAVAKTADEMVGTLLDVLA